jgi:sulfatase maturation enzyme AslB (radical SAM superfamily)
VTGEGYGRFLIDVFEEWVRRDVGEVYVQMFDSTLDAGQLGRRAAGNVRALRDLWAGAGARAYRRRGLL